MLNLLLDGDFEGSLTAKKWGLLTKISPDTALRDIVDLIERGILVKDEGKARATTYSLVGIRIRRTENRPSGLI